MICFLYHHYLENHICYYFYFDSGIHWILYIRVGHFNKQKSHYAYSVYLLILKIV